MISNGLNVCVKFSLPKSIFPVGLVCCRTGKFCRLHCYGAVSSLLAFHCSGAPECGGYKFLIKHIHHRKEARNHLSNLEKKNILIMKFSIRIKFFFIKKDF